MRSWRRRAAREAPRAMRVVSSRERAAERERSRPAMLTQPMRRTRATAASMSFSFAVRPAAVAFPLSRGTATLRSLYIAGMCCSCQYEAKTEVSWPEAAASVTPGLRRARIV